MRIDNYFTQVSKQKKHFDDAALQTVYEQPIKILGAAMTSPTQIIYICNDKSQFGQASNQFTKVQSLDILTNKSTLIQKIPYQNSSFEILKTVYYNSYSVKAIESTAEYIAADKCIINCVCESQTQDYYLVALNSKIVLLNQYLLPIQEIDMSAHFIQNISTSSTCDQFIAAYTGEEKSKFTLIQLQKGQLQVITAKQNEELLPFFSVDLHDVQQLLFSHGVFNSYKALCLYCNYGRFGDYGTYGQHGHFVHTVSCYNFELNRVEYVYPGVAPVLRICSSTYLFEVGDVLFDLLCYADAAGFLHLSLGGVQEGQKRIFSIQTNMWVKNITFQFTEVEDNGTFMVKRNNFIEDEDKLVDVQVQRELKIFVFGSTELVKGDTIVQADGFSVLYVNLDNIQQIADAEKFVLSDSDEFSYLDYKKEPSIVYKSQVIECSESVHDAAQDEAEDEEEDEWEDAQVENTNTAETQLQAQLQKIQQPAQAQQPQQTQQPAKKEAPQQKAAAQPQPQTIPVSNKLLFGDLFDQYVNYPLLTKIHDNEQKRVEKQKKKMQELAIISNIALQAPVETQDSFQPKVVLDADQLKAKTQYEKKLQETTNKLKDKALNPQPDPPQPKPRQPKQRRQVDDDNENIIAEFAPTVTNVQADQVMNTQQQIMQKQVQLQSEINKQTQMQMELQKLKTQNLEIEAQVKTKQIQQQYSLKDGSELKLLQIYLQSKLTIMIHAQTRIILEHFPDYILIMDQKFHVVMDKMLQIYDKYGILIDQIQFKDRIKLVFGQNQVFSADQVVHEQLVPSNLFVITKSQVVEVSSKQAKEVQFDFEHFSVFAENTNIFIQSENQIYILIDQPILLSNYGFLQELAPLQQLKITLQQSKIPNQLYALSQKSFINRELNKKVTLEIDNVNQIQQFALLQLIIKQGENEKTYLQNKNLYDLAVQEFLNAFEGFDDEMKKVARNYAIGAEDEQLKGVF
ncbi:Conserved_hypothetical protein [Hexamita inflata]|uniref:Uncharacterized protein n=1 Tax=Hexamita inflata TaxID=28002 RepID=A0AA86R3H7_9EUKA|nr:Conserved hypothetical protein [Hexamita inflata]